jgi:hypothetical protein
MEYRFDDVNKDKDGPPADYVGGLSNVDLWVSTGERFKLIICQYEISHLYVSYSSASALWADAKGELEESEYSNTPIDEVPDGAEYCWGLTGEHRELVGHNPREIARYLALFAPYVFSEAERKEILG